MIRTFGAVWFEPGRFQELLELLSNCLENFLQFHCVFLLDGDEEWTDEDVCSGDEADANPGGVAALGVTSETHPLGAATAETELVVDDNALDDDDGLFWKSYADLPKKMRENIEIWFETEISSGVGKEAWRIPKGGSSWWVKMSCTIKTTCWTKTNTVAEKNASEKVCDKD